MVCGVGGEVWAGFETHAIMRDTILPKLISHDTQKHAEFQANHHDIIKLADGRNLRMQFIGNSGEILTLQQMQDTLSDRKTGMQLRAA